MKSRIEQMLRVQRVKLTGPGISSVSPERNKGKEKRTAKA